jgi:hypothetical protein
MLDLQPDQGALEQDRARRFGADDDPVMLAQVFHQLGQAPWL